MHNGAGYQLLDQQWIASEPTTGVPPPPTTTTTAAPTTTTPPYTGTTTTTTSGPTTTTLKPPTPEPTETPADGAQCSTFPCLIFSDEFDKLDFNKWSHEITAGGGGNWEFQYYHNNRSNSYVRDGLLYIRPTETEEKFGPGFLSSGTLELWGSSPNNLCTGNQWWGCNRVGDATNYINPLQSARLRTATTFNTRYGRVEVRAKMPKGDWLWPAIWMLPAHNPYGEWPASGEIDIVESRGNRGLRDEGGNLKGHQKGGSTMHWGPYMPHNGYSKTTVEYNLTDTFHTYAVAWTNQSVTFYLDDVEQMVVDPVTNFWDFGEFGLPTSNNPWVGGEKMAPFDESFYLVMNVAVGGTNGFFPDTWTNDGYPKPWNNLSPTGPRDFWEQKSNWAPTWVGEDAAMQVEYVRVWKMEDSNQ